MLGVLLWKSPRYSALLSQSQCVFGAHCQSVTVKEYTRVVHNVFSFETITVKQPIGGTNTESF